MTQVLGIIGFGGFELLILLAVAALFLILPILALIDILRSQFQDPNNKLIWVIVVLFLNLIGAILYYAIGRKQRVA